MFFGLEQRLEQCFENAVDGQHNDVEPVELERHDHLVRDKVFEGHVQQELRVQGRKNEQKSQEMDVNLAHVGQTCRKVGKVPGLGFPLVLVLEQSSDRDSRRLFHRGKQHPGQQRPVV